MELLICTIMTSDTASNYGMQIRKMADHNLLLVAIPEDTHKSLPACRRLLFPSMIFELDLGRNF